MDDSVKVKLMGYTMANKKLTLALFKSEPDKYELYLNIILAAEFERGFKAKKVNRPTKTGTSIKFIPIESKEEARKIGDELSKKLKAMFEIIGNVYENPELVEGERMAKIYAYKRYSSEDKKLFEMLYMEKVLNEKGEKVKALRLRKALCNAIRKQMTVRDLIGLVPVIEKKDKKKIILINLYNIQATENNYFQQHYDEEARNFYIEDQELLEG